MRSTLVVATIAFVASCVGHAKPRKQPVRMWPTIDEAMLTASVETRQFAAGTPGIVALTQDGALLFRRTPPRSRIAELFEVGPDGKERKLASAAALLAGGTETLSDAEKARRERTRTVTTGIVGVGVSDDGRWLLVPIGERLFVLDRSAPDPGATARELQVGPGFPLDPRLAPTGDRVAFVRDGAVFVVPVSGGAAPLRITDAGTETVEYGAAEFVAQEELGRSRGYWWSPDGKRLIIQRSDVTAVDVLHVSDPRNPERPAVPFRYPRAGRANADISLSMYTVDGKGPPRPITWDRQRYPYLGAVDWPKAGRPTITVLDREQRELRLLAIDLTTGGTEPLAEDRDDAWVNLEGGPWWLGDGSGFLWMHEKEGDWVLEHRKADGSLVRKLTEPAFGLRSVGGIDDVAKVVWVTASADPTESHVFAINLADGTARKHDSEGVFHRVVHKYGRTAIVSVPKQGLTQLRVMSASGETPVTSVAESPSYWPTTQLETVEAGGHTFHVAITRPRSFVPGRRYPVLHYVYGGPHAQMVEAPSREYFSDQLYADAGFIIVRGDNRGTPARGKTWERSIVGDLATVPIADSVAILRAVAAKHPELDLARVGVWGWSFGGYLAAMLTMRHPELYKAGIAGAPVTDWELYDTAYTERYMKLPKDNPEGYRRANVLTYAGQLRRPLLLLHGITDDNVHFAHSLALIEALYLHGKRAELVTLSSTHMVPDPKQKLALERIQLEFFREHLGPP